MGKDKPKNRQEQFDMLLRCSKKGDITEWNQWRGVNLSVEINLQGANLAGANLQKAEFADAKLQEADFRGANLQEANLVEAKLQKACLIGTNLKEAVLWFAKLQKANLKGANLQGANLEYVNLQEAYLADAKLQEANLGFAKLQGADLEGAKLQGTVFWEANLRETYLQGAKLMRTNLRGAEFGGAKLQKADFSRAIVDGETLIWRCEVDEKTMFEGVGLGSARIYPEVKQLLEYNISRMNCEAWYKKHRVLQWLVRWFWHLSDYGKSTGRIIFWFFWLAGMFACVYHLCPSCVQVNEKVGAFNSFFHAIYFSIVTMTTLGFGDISANPESWLGQLLLILQVLLGYVLLGALVTRFAVLFNAGGPAGQFAEEYKKPKDEQKQ